MMAVFAVVIAAGTLLGVTGTALAQSTTTIEDTSVGSGLNQVAYQGSWFACTVCPPPTANNSYRYSTAGGAQATIRFNGTAISIYGVKDPSGGQASISVDGGTPVVVDTFAATCAAALLRTISGLTAADHTAVILNRGQRGSPGTGTVVAFDRAVVTAAENETPLGFRSGLPWLSGAFGGPNQVPATNDAFCAYRGAPCDLAHVFLARNSWAAIVQPSFAETNYQGWPGRLLISAPLFPENAGASLTTCATGAYDANWRTFGNTLNSSGRQNSIIRLGWQANGDWFQWAATNAAAYRSCWQHVADAIRSTANPDPVLDWTINAHYSQEPPSHNPADIYPGDQWVDSIGIDSYDHYPPSPTLAAFNAQAQAVGGITWLYNFARAHGKQFGVGEWGVAPGSGQNGGGDNANFIQWMWDWFQARAGQGLLYESYFNTCEPGNVGSNLYQPVGPGCVIINPASSARYRSLWGGQ
jgi:hypothetical protein